MYMMKLMKAYEVYAKKTKAYYRPAEADDEEVDDENDEGEGGDESATDRPATIATGFSDDDDDDMATAPSTRRGPAAAVELRRAWKEEFKAHYKNFRTR